MSRRNFFLLVSSLGAGLIICLFLGIVLIINGRATYTWVQELPGTSTATVQPTDRAATPTVPARVINVPSPTATYTPAPRCGGPSSMVLVLLGTDSRNDSYTAGLADSIRLVRVDFINPSVMVLPFQRDLYVEIPGLAEHGIIYGKLNQAYTYGTPAFGYFDAPNQGLGLMEQTMEQNFGAHVEYGVAVNMQSFVRIVDALGGIDIDLPYAIDGRVVGSRDPVMYFAAGEQHLDGRRTQILARLRPQGDIERANVQTMILQALSAKLLSPNFFSQLPELVSALQGSVYTDLGAEQIAQLTCLAVRLDPQKIVYVNFPEDLFLGTRVQDPVLGYTFIFDADFDVLRRYVTAFMNGTWPGMPRMTPAPAP
jgi:LCP family protein required for cell wall assembly